MEESAAPAPDAEETEPEKQPEESRLLDPVTVQSWLNRVKPGAILALLKDPDYGLTVSRVFLGFRPDAKGFANPLVRSRLAQAASKDFQLADKLRQLAETEPTPSSILGKPSSAPSKASMATLEKPDPVLGMRAERDQRRRERDEARQALAQVQAERDVAKSAWEAAETERDEAVRLVKKHSDRIARLDRQVARLQQGETRLLKALSEDKVSPPPSSRPRSSQSVKAETEPTISTWLTAVRHLLDKSKFDQALALAEDVLKSEPDNADALEIAARALEGKKDLRSAVYPARLLLAVQITHKEMAAAAETLFRLLRLLPSPEDAKPEARQYLAALTPGNNPAIEAGRLLLSRLRGADPIAYRWLAGMITAQESLVSLLMPLPGALGPDDPLPLQVGLGRTVTARQLVEAIDGGMDLVDTVRASLTPLETTDQETFKRIWTALEHAAVDDPARLIPVQKTPRGPVVVDGSNVAWFDQESLVHGKPRLRHLLALRRALWMRGFFPVVLYADANLPYFVDDSPALRTMRDRRELTLVDAGTVADEVLLRTAKLLDAPLVTNDKMEDWDPEGEVFKVRYTISMSGEAHLLADL